MTSFRVRSGRTCWFAFHKSVKRGRPILLRINIATSEIFSTSMVVTTSNKHSRFRCFQLARIPWNLILVGYILASTFRGVVPQTIRGRTVGNVNARRPIQYNRRHETTWTWFQIEGWFLIVPWPQCAFISKALVENNVFLCIGGRPKCLLKPNSRYIRARYTRICSHTNVHKLIGTLEMCSLWPSSR